MTSVPYLAWVDLDSGACLAHGVDPDPPATLPPTALPLGYLFPPRPGAEWDPRARGWLGRAAPNLPVGVVAPEGFVVVPVDRRSNRLRGDPGTIVPVPASALDVLLVLAPEPGSAWSPARGDFERTFAAGAEGGLDPVVPVSPTAPTAPPDAPAPAAPVTLSGAAWLDRLSIDEVLAIDAFAQSTAVAGIGHARAALARWVLRAGQRGRLNPTHPRFVEWLGRASAAGVLTEAQRAALAAPVTAADAPD